MVGLFFVHPLRIIAAVLPVEPTDSAAYTCASTFWPVVSQLQQLEDTGFQFQFQDTQPNSPTRVACHYVLTSADTPARNKNAGVSSCSGRTGCAGCTTHFPSVRAPTASNNKTRLSFYIPFNDFVQACPPRTRQGNIDAGAQWIRCAKGVDQQHHLGQYGARPCLFNELAYCDVISGSTRETTHLLNKGTMF